MTKRAGSPKPRSRSQTQTIAEKVPERQSAVGLSKTLDSIEEKTVRMRRGLSAPDELMLEQKGAGHPAVMAKLREMELRALTMSGRLEELQEDVGLSPSTSKKQKIVDALSHQKDS